MMKRLIIEKLVIISNSEKTSREVNFTDGLNIIIGENKTGKSSIIKSIFYSLGCETEMDKSWLDLIDIYILKFRYGFKNYYILRKDKSYRIIYESEQLGLIIETNSFSEFSECLVKKIFEIEAELIDKHENIISFIPPILFRYQYIDQENGWRKLGESFLNMKFVKNWKNDGIKFVIGYQDEKYYNIKKDKEIILSEIKNLTVKSEHFEEIIKNIKEYMIENYTELNLKDSYILKQKTQEIIDKLSLLERKKLKVEKNILNIENNIYINNLEIKILKESIKELEKDYNYACNQEEKIICPTCGKTYCNSINEKIELIKNVQNGEELLSYYRNEIKELELELERLVKEKYDIKATFNCMKLQLNKIEETVDVTNFYKYKGREDIIKVSEEEKEKILKEIEGKNIFKTKYEDDIKKLLSRKRQNKIKSDFTDIYKKLLEKVNVDEKYLKLRNFEQVLEHTGSEKPRIILAYYVALYLYNLSRGENIFNFLIIDTPNQQGQDAENLKNIDSVLDLLLDDRGQAILGTERITGYEELANNIVKLKEYKKCLVKEKYNDHIKLSEILNSVK